MPDEVKDVNLQQATANLVQEIHGMVKDARGEMPVALEQAATMAAQDKMNSAILEFAFGGLLVCLAVGLNYVFTRQIKRCVDDRYEEGSWRTGRIVVLSSIFLIISILAFTALGHVMDANLIKNNPKAYILNTYVRR